MKNLHKDPQALTGYSMTISNIVQTIKDMRQRTQDPTTPLDKDDCMYALNHIIKSKGAALTIHSKHTGEDLTELKRWVLVDMPAVDWSAVL